jgi:hypothetical protein
MLGRAMWWLGATVSDEPYISVFRVEKSLSGHISDEPYISVFRVEKSLSGHISDEPYISVFRVEKSLSGHITLREDRFLHIDPRENQRRIFELKSQEMRGGGVTR